MVKKYQNGQIGPKCSKIVKNGTTIVPACGVAPSAPSVISPLASPVCVPVLVAERQAVVALAPAVVLVVESLVLVVESLVLEVAVEPIVVVVVEGLAVVAAAATMRLLATKEATKEPAYHMFQFGVI